MTKYLHTMIRVSSLEDTIAFFEVLVLWTAACMPRKRWADRADLNRCILRSRRRTG